MKKWFSCLAALSLVLTVSCAKKYWVPNADHLKLAESVAKFYSLKTLSDQADEAEVKALTWTPGGPEVAYPIAFSFQYTPYSRYRLKYWGDQVEGHRRIHVLYFNPAEIPNWENQDVMTGEFPAHFSVIVDMETLQAVESTPPQRPAMP